MLGLRKKCCFLPWYIPLSDFKDAQPWWKRCKRHPYLYVHEVEYSKGSILSRLLNSVCLSVTLSYFPFIQIMTAAYIYYLLYQRERKIKNFKPFLYLRTCGYRFSLKAVWPEGSLQNPLNFWQNSTRIPLKSEMEIFKFHQKSTRKLTKKSSIPENFQLIWVILGSNWIQKTWNKWKFVI